MKMTDPQLRPTIVVTTIQAPTPSMVKWGEILPDLKYPLILIGDKKGPFEYSVPAAELFTLKDQADLPYKIGPLLPTGHYARKNLGYLLAFERNAPVIYETDDDNAPLASWKARTERIQARPIAGSGWMNVYRLFSQENIWPRGLPLNVIHKPIDASSESSEFVAPIQQALANGSPDVDAVWRLVLDKDIVFQNGSSFLLPRGVWCPFNSQSTWWWPVAFPLMYLPSYCSFRMTDIWRSFIAQRCLWELDTGIVFHSAEVWQARNPHNLMRDFKDEVCGYLRNAEIAEILSKLRLESGPESVKGNLLKCYEALVGAKVFEPEELHLVQAWLDDLNNVEANRQNAFATVH
jgi:hypothetical protein